MTTDISAKFDERIKALERELDQLEDQVKQTEKLIDKTEDSIRDHKSHIFSNVIDAVNPLAPIKVIGENRAIDREREELKHEEHDLETLHQKIKEITNKLQDYRFWRNFSDTDNLDKQREAERHLLE